MYRQVEKNTNKLLNVNKTWESNPVTSVIRESTGKAEVKDNVKQVRISSTVSVLYIKKYNIIIN